MANKNKKKIGFEFFRVTRARHQRRTVIGKGSPKRRKGKHTSRNFGKKKYAAQYYYSYSSPPIQDDDNDDDDLTWEHVGNVRLHAEACPIHTDVVTPESRASAFFGNPSNESAKRISAKTFSTQPVRTRPGHTRRCTNAKTFRRKQYM